MKNRSALVQILTFLVAFTGAYGGLFTPTGQAWLGIVAFTATLLLNTPFITNADFTKGWDKALWAVNIAAIVVQILQLIADKTLLPPVTINYIIIGINMIILTLFKFPKP